MIKKKIRAFFRNFFFCLLALSIPGLLVLNGIQSSKYRTLKKEVEDLERKQETLIEENKKLITDISLLSSSDRIEKIAEEDLGMRQAESEEIVRVGVPGAKENKK
ncbi:cell division protein FtsL [Treponema sp.]|uniref:cell division protein FtsL n=1 Tax=Treponema sp. TaxID=166 RepID=UPI00298E977C|nr:cell division protein FtsL [Treponema sp.]MCQ2241298.1 cell division protein FtsL [Treponema sp.]